MKMRNAFATILLGIGLLASANAQLTELRSRMEGRGSLNFRARSSSNQVNAVEVNLRRDGRAEIKLVSGASETFTGFWNNDGNRKCRITIDKVGRDNARGSGTVEHDGRGSFTRVDVDGTVGGLRFDLDFRADGSSGGGGNFTELRSTRDGQGTWNFQTRSSSSRVTRITAAFSRDHTYEIKVVAGATDTVRGRWWMDGKRMIKFDVDRLGNSNVSGSGTVYLDGRGSFDRVTMNGRNGTYVFNLDFQSISTGGGNWEEKKFLDAARDAIRSKFSRGTIFTWSDETVGKVVFGNRTVKGELRTRGGDKPGTYRYTVVLGAGTASVRSATYSRK